MELLKDVLKQLKLIKYFKIIRININLEASIKHIAINVIF